MEGKLKNMSGLVALASALLMAPAAPAHAGGRHILSGVVAGVAAHKLAEAHHERQERKRAEEAGAAAPKPRKPSPMGKAFDDEMGARLARAKAEREAARQANGQAGQPSFAAQFKERLAASRAKARSESAMDGPAAGRAPGP